MFQQKYRWCLTFDAVYIINKSCRVKRQGYVRKERSGFSIRDYGSAVVCSVQLMEGLINVQMACWCDQL